MCLINYACVYPALPFLDKINWQKCFRYSCYGALVSAPMFYGWIRILNRIWPKRSLSTAVRQAIVEQFTYTPTSISAFFFTMALCDNNFDIEAARNELKRKFWDSYKVSDVDVIFRQFIAQAHSIQIGLCYWPIAQTINLTFVPHKNRVVFISLCGLVWVTFLAFVDIHGNALLSQLDNIEINDPKTLKTQA